MCSTVAFILAYVICIAVDASQLPHSWVIFSAFNYYSIFIKIISYIFSNTTMLIIDHWPLISYPNGKVGCYYLTYQYTIPLCSKDADSIHTTVSSIHHYKQKHSKINLNCGFFSFSSTATDSIDCLKWSTECNLFSLQYATCRTPVLNNCRLATESPDVQNKSRKMYPVDILEDSFWLMSCAIW